MSPLESAPNEIIEEIAFHVALLAFLGPPAALLAFLCVSKRINTVISRENNPRLYARIFARKFDVTAPRRRLDDINTHDLADELVRRCLVLQHIRRNAYPRPLTPGDPDDGDLREHMWTAYIMFLESDGHNARQLIEYARIDRFAQDFVQAGGRLHDGADENGGWVVDSEINALGTWLFWFTDKGSPPITSVGAHVDGLSLPTQNAFAQRHPRSVTTFLEHCLVSMRPLSRYAPFP
jgi:hypothetical protein